MSEVVYSQLVVYGAAPSNIREWQAHDKKFIRKRRKLDLAMNASHGSQKCTELNWKTLASVCEVKYHSQAPLEFEAHIQVVDKAFFTLSSQLNRRYFVGIMMCGPQMRILLFSRGGSAISSPIDIHKSPLDFLYVLTAFMAGDLSWLGYDKNFYIGLNDSFWILYAGSAYEIIQLLFQSCSIQGRGTRIMVIRDKFNNELILKDCWLHVGWPTDIEIHQLLEDPNQELKGLVDETIDAIFGWKDKYGLFWGVFQSHNWDDKNLCGIPIFHSHEYIMWGTGNGGKVQDTIENLLGEISESYEPWQHIQVSFYTCAIPITWFSCAREFFNAAMGVLVGKKGFKF